MVEQENVGIDGKESNEEINEMATDVAKVVYKDQLRVLRDTLERFHTPESRYTIMGTRDDSYCMVYRNGNWITFTSERGVETSVSVFDSIDDACFKVMYYMSGDTEEYDQMVFYYKHSMDDVKRDNFTSKDLFVAVKNGIEKLKKTVAAV